MNTRSGFKGAAKGGPRMCQGLGLHLLGLGQPREPYGLKDTVERVPGAKN